MKPPFRCRLFGHDCGEFTVQSGWLIIDHPCRRCGWEPLPFSARLREADASASASTRADGS